MSVSGIILRDDIGLDGNEELAGFVHALFDALSFRVEPGVVVGQKPIILFFGKDLRESNRQLPRFDQVQTEQAPHRPMGGYGYAFGKQHGAGCMENGIVGP